MNHLFKDVRLIDPLNNTDSQIHLWVKNGSIRNCSANMPKVDGDTEIIDGKKLVAAPGFFDMHVHFREPGYEYKEDIETGTASAANGGFTGVCVMPNTNPTIDNPTVVEFIKNKSSGNIVDVRCSAKITVGGKGERLTPMFELADYGVIQFTDDGTSIMNADLMKRAFDYALTKDLLLAQHCEEHSMTSGFAMNESPLSARLGLKGYPSVAEEMIVARDVALSRYCGNARYHAQHLSSANSIDIIAAAKKEGLRVSCEAAPHHFFSTEEALDDYDSNYKMNPPLRSQKDVDRIIEGLANGDIDCIASDHAPHALHEKQTEFELAACGIIGLETSVAIALTALHHKAGIDLKRIVELFSTEPRKILNLNQIDVSVGQPANLTIFDPADEWVVDPTAFKSKSKNTPYAGVKLKGKPKYVVNNGKVSKSQF